MNKLDEKILGSEKKLGGKSTMTKAGLKTLAISLVLAIVFAVVGPPVAMAAQASDAWEVGANSVAMPAADRVDEPPIIIPPIQPEPPITMPAEGEFDRATKIAEEFLDKNADGTLTLNMPKEVIKTIGRDIYAQLQVAITHTNKMISAGYLTFDEHFNAQVTGRYLHRVQTEISLNEDLRSRDVDITITSSGDGIGISSDSGWTGISWRLWGFYVYLSDDTTDYIAFRLAIGGGVAAIVAALVALVPGLTPVASAFVITAALYGMGAASLHFHNEYNAGVRLRFILGIYSGIWPQIP